MEKTLLSLVKFGKKKHIEMLQKKGLIYMNTFKYFQEFENNTEKGDKNENLSYHLQPSQGLLIINNKELNNDQIASPIRYWGSEKHSDFSHIFCMSCIIQEEIKIKSSKIFDKIEWEDEVDSLLIIHDITRFFKRLDSSIKKQSIEILRIEGQQVEYINNNEYHGKMGAFKKYESFSHQKEWRLALKAKKNHHLHFKLYLGSLDDISKIVKRSEFKNEIK